VAKVDIPQGVIITEETLSVKRPGTGIEPRYLDMIIGRRVKVVVKQNEIITKDKLSG
tara:strand:+ start:373 stop:543 length:171 start_codon:yes stop_codon:yes gene_type:complete